MDTGEHYRSLVPIINFSLRYSKRANFVYRYWDWQVDWHDLASSSLWNNDHGFGGQTDDQTGTETQLPGEQCVPGPFEGVVLLNFNFSIHPHCLSRHFQHPKLGETVLGNLINPEAMGQLARSPDYGFLRYMIEMQMHNFIHSGVILGDLNTASSANGQFIPLLREVDLASS